MFESRRGKRIGFQQEPEGNSRAGAPGSWQCPDCQWDVASSWDEAWKTWGVQKYRGKGGEKRRGHPGFCIGRLLPDGAGWCAGGQRQGRAVLSLRDLAAGGPGAATCPSKGSWLLGLFLLAGAISQPSYLVFTGNSAKELSKQQVARTGLFGTGPVPACSHGGMQTVNKGFFGYFL